MADRQKIKKYLLSDSCKPSVSGFNVLMHVIELSKEHPDLSCQDLFKMYAEENNTKYMAAYHAARYCLDNSLSAEKSVNQFIRASTLNLED